MFLSLVAVVACGSADERPPPSSTPLDSGSISSDTGTADTGAAVVDSGTLDSGSTPTDAGMPDSGAQDTGTSDTGVQDTWTSFAQGFSAAYCVECHGAGNRRRDYTTFRDLFRDRDEVRCGVAPPPTRPSTCSGFPPPGQFPVGTGPKPSNEDRQRIVDWVDNGAPEG